MPTNHL